jgi:hypothetical protein
MSFTHHQRNLYKASKTGGVVYTSLVQQLCTLLFDEKRPELKDINKISAASIGNLFKYNIHIQLSCK